jgi:hypothetical protein
MIIIVITRKLCIIDLNITWPNFLWYLFQSNNARVITDILLKKYKTYVSKLLLLNSQLSMLQLQNFCIMAKTNYLMIWWRCPFSLDQHGVLPNWSNTQQADRSTRTHYQNTRGNRSLFLLLGNVYLVENTNCKVQCDRGTCFKYGLTNLI